MKTKANKENTHSPFQTKMKNQGTQNSILQAYKDKTTQLQSADEEELVQGKFETTQLASEEESLQRQPNNTGLPDNLKSGIESLSGYSMNDVNVHYNSSQPATLQAHAYAQGTDIHVAPGQEKHVPHEAWHVVQQKQGRVKPTKQMKGKVNVNNDTGLEKEADVMGAKAMQLKSEENKSKLVNTRSKEVSQRKSQETVIQNHSKQCGCANCSGTKQSIQKKENPSAESIVQLKPCAECKKEKGHLSGCSRHKHNRSTTGRGTHKLGGSHDDGSGFQRSGAGGDRHEKGRRAAQRAQERKEGKS